MNFLNVDELILKNTIVKNVISNTYDFDRTTISSVAVDVPSVNKVVELSSLSNNYENVSMLDTIYLFESKNDVFDNTYNCRWSVSKIGDIFTPADDFNSFCKATNGSLTIPSKAIFKNKLLHYYNGKISSVSANTISITLNNNIATFSFGTISDKLCLKNYFFDKPTKIGFTLTELNKMFSGPSCSENESLNENSENVEQIIFNGDVIYIPRIKYVYTESQTLSGIVLKTISESDLQNYFTDNICLNYTFEEIASININGDKIDVLNLSNEFDGKLNFTGSGFIKIFYPTYNFSKNNIEVSSEITRVDLHINESYIKGKTSDMTNNNNISDLWIDLEFFAGEEFESEDTPIKKYGDFSKLTALECIHVPKDYLKYSTKSITELTTYLQNLFNVECLIGFY